MILIFVAVFFSVFSRYQNIIFLWILVMWNVVEWDVVTCTMITVTQKLKMVMMTLREDTEDRSMITTEPSSPSECPRLWIICSMSQDMIQSSGKCQLIEMSSLFLCHCSGLISRVIPPLLMWTFMFAAWVRWTRPRVSSLLISTSDSTGLTTDSGSTDPKEWRGWRSWCWTGSFSPGSGDLTRTSSMARSRIFTRWRCQTDSSGDTGCSRVVSHVFLRISPEGRVSYSQRLTVSARCKMNLRKFPHDSQSCPLKVSSFGHSGEELVYR